MQDKIKRVWHGGSSRGGGPHGGSRRGDGQVSPHFFTYAERVGKKINTLNSPDQQQGVFLQLVLAFIAVQAEFRRENGTNAKTWHALNYNIQNRAKTHFSIASNA